MATHSLHPSRVPPWLALVGFFVASFAAAGVGGIASVNAASYYASLDRPPWAPPAALFGPVWSVLYATIALAGWVAWRERGLRALPFGLYAGQLVLNAAWTWLFFSGERFGAAFVEIVALWAVILATMVVFWRIKRGAGALLIPYLLWVTYASALNLALWLTN